MSSGPKSAAKGGAAEALGSPTHSTLPFRALVSLSPEWGELPALCAAYCETRTVPCRNCSLAPGHSPLSTTLHSRLWGCLVLPLLFLRVPYHRMTCLSQLCPWPGMCFLPSPNPPPWMGRIIHVTCHSQWGDSPGSTEVPLCSPAYVCPFGGGVPIVLSCSSPV